ncbi:MAG: hypothetical protein Q9214_000504 [Letrouitia sp. 1 TL-2023]
MFSELFPLPYAYKALKPAGQLDGQFRLLTLLPGEIGSDLYGQLQHASLDAPCMYEALSYTWGDPYPERSRFHNNKADCFGAILLDGVHVKIGSNLEAALQSLRERNEPRILWVDAICINQRDTAERNEQVKVMGRIFEGAKRVLAWLGPQGEDSDLAFESLEQLVWSWKGLLARHIAVKHQLPIPVVLHDPQIFSNVLDKTKRYWFLEEVKSYFCEEKTLSKAWSMVSVNIHCSASTSLLECAIATWGPGSLAAALISDDIEKLSIQNIKAIEDAIYKFFARRYWQRLWIVQELCFAVDVSIHCGDRHINMAKLSLIYQFLKFFDPDSSCNHLIKHLEGFLLAVHASIAGISSFLVILGAKKLLPFYVSRQVYHVMKCSEPRDAIYALLNISEPVDIEIDYDNPVDEVYLKATRMIIESQQILKIITVMPLPDSPKTELKLPSWVPHFQLGFSDYGSWRFESGGPSLPSDLVYQREDCQSLQVRGYFYSGIVELIITKFKLGPGGAGSDISKALKILTKVHGKSASPDFKLQFWTILLMDHYPSLAGPTSCRISRSPAMQTLLLADIEEMLRTQPPERICNAVSASMFLKTLCKTLEGHWILALGDIEVGDRIFVARGAPCPLILRPAASETTLDNSDTAGGDLKAEFQHLAKFERFTLVGIAYVKGIMDGEWLERAPLEGILEEDILLV